MGKFHPQKSHDVVEKIILVLKKNMKCVKNTENDEKCSFSHISSIIFNSFFKNLSYHFLNTCYHPM